MKTNPRYRHPAGYVAYVMVISTAAILTFMLIFAYKRALLSQSVQSTIQLRVDYNEKEDVILRSIVAITPNRAMRAMRNGSAAAGTSRDSLRWQNIFADAVIQANAGTSITTDGKKNIGQGNSVSSNAGDGALGTTNLMFTNVHGAANTVYVTPGINRTLSKGFPEALVSTDGTVNTNDLVYPIIANSKNYNGLAAKEYKTLKYPAINFGYAKPGENFLAKRNWWGFSMDLADHDNGLTGTALSRREFVLSIYEVPSQLAISASSFVNLGKYKDGVDWKNIDISGNVFADSAVVEAGAVLPGLSTRGGLTLDRNATVGGKKFDGNPFTPGVREAYEVANGGYFPISMPSESGRAAFIPINRGADFFDRHSVTNDDETNTLSTTAWNDYSSGAKQCAMRLDVTKVTGGASPSPTEFRFHYYKGGSRRYDDFPPIQGTAASVPIGFTHVANRNDTYYFSEPVDVAYGTTSKLYFKSGVSGNITFSDSAFGWSGGGTRRGYFRPRVPFTTTVGPQGRICVSVFPERFPKFLAAIGADNVTMNNSLVVNSDYRSNVAVKKPSFPIASGDFGLILNECANLSSFTKGFSLVTNYRLYIGSDFNTVSIAAPAGYTGTLPYYPPCSLFAPEKRFGADSSPYAVGVTGQIGSLAAKDNTDEDKAARPLDSRGINDALLNPANTTMNLRPMVDPADLPPVTMMNWLVVIEERRKEFW
ncbi:hypothetical protein OVA24_09490 [Luteolibacter sp. SL250]|uniref:hypothetical protein n=1 Tax=Luteolibacter sp. SL250 TaxID=2995170 RepID=UPI00226D758C|nr:hypothetical protein [Luteolibacter sp. SL250]WAC21616.1 hypothetical protein OVA24_09490 [Luteolibacter sp. SL250]